MTATRPTHATLAVFAMDLAREDDQRRILDELIVPGVRGTAGVLGASWTLDREASESTVLVLFSSAKSASRFEASVASNAVGRAEVGLSLRSIRVVDVLANI